MVSLGFLPLFTLGVARAQSAPAIVPFSLQYTAPQGCPTREDFEGAIVRRAPRAHSTIVGAGVTRFNAELVELGPGRVRGSLRVAQPDGAETRRAVDAQSCAQAIDYMALIAALILDPAAQALPTSPSQPLLPAGEGPSETEARVSPEPTPTGAERRLEKNRTEPAASHSKVATTRVRAGAWLGGTRESGVAPSAPLGMVLGVEASLDRASSWSPSLQASFLYTARAEEEMQSSGEASFRLIAARLALCPWRSPGPLRFRACAEFDAGALVVDAPQAQNMPWLAAGPSLQAEVDTGRVLALRLNLGAHGLLHHDRFLSGGDQLVYDVPAVSWHLDLGLVVRTP
ncbi:MAG TPA: hypothetical protein VFQ61_14895 [Polyangiaceae bacterium]|nr:hypothetical protein [Polyangiaceae bacterium]